MFFSPRVDYRDLSLLDLLRKVYAPASERLAAVTSLDDYETQLRHFNAYFRYWLCQAPNQALRDPTLRDLTDEHIRGAMEWQVNRGRSRETANKIHRVLCALWRFADTELRCMPDRPRVKRFKVLKRQRKTWNPAEFQAILDQIAKLPALECDVGRGVNISRAQLLITLLLLIANVGGRITATLLAGPQALDHQRRTIKLAAENQKQGRDQTFQLTDEVYEALLALRPGDFPRLIPWAYDQNWDTRTKTWRDPHLVNERNRQGKWRTLTKLYRSVLVAAELPNTRKDLFHAIRACVATWICDKLGEQAASEYMGHSSVTVTRVYFDYSQISGEHSAVNVLPKFQMKLFAS